MTALTPAPRRTRERHKSASATSVPIAPLSRGEWTAPFDSRSPIGRRRREAAGAAQRCPGVGSLTARRRSSRDVAAPREAVRATRLATRARQRTGVSHSGGGSGRLSLCTAPSSCSVGGLTASAIWTGSRSRRPRLPKPSTHNPSGSGGVRGPPIEIPECAPTATMRHALHRRVPVPRRPGC